MTTPAPRSLPAPGGLTSTPTMPEPLTGLRVVEAASFIARPSCGLHLAQLGAEVIRIDPIGGGPDYHRWPITPEGASLYWEGLNKGKKYYVSKQFYRYIRPGSVRVGANSNNSNVFVSAF